MSQTHSVDLPFLELPVEDNITLRQLRPEEASSVYAIVDANRDHLQRWLAWVNGTNSEKDVADFIEVTLEKRRKGTEYGYAICLDGVPVGHMSLMYIHEEPEIGYWVSSEVAGQGIVTKAAQALTDFGIKTLGLQKIVIRVNPENIASNRVAEKLGYTLLGTSFSERLNETVNVWSISSDKAS